MYAIPVMLSAKAWVLMCHPSAYTAIEPNNSPVTISTTIMVEVIPTTIHVRFSALVFPR
jgi:hypothetical protein